MPEKSKLRFALMSAIVFALLVFATPANANPDRVLDVLMGTPSTKSDEGETWTERPRAEAGRLRMNPWPG